jgi:hypothetical protein
MSVRDRVGRLVGRSRQARIATLVTALALAAAALGFIALDTDDSSDGDGSQDPYVAEADRVCVEGKATIVRVGQQIFAPPQPANVVATYAAATLQSLNDTRSRLAALEPPADLRDRAATFDARLGELASELEELERAGRVNDPARIQAANLRVESVTVDADQAAAALGLERCAMVRVSLNAQGSG